MKSLKLKHKIEDVFNAKIPKMKTQNSKLVD